MAGLRNLNRTYTEGRICGTPYVGVLGSEVPSTGDNGAGYLYNDLTLPADASKRVCGRITTWPSAGTLTAYEDSSFSFTAPDGSYTFDYQLYVEGVSTGSPVTVYLTVGSLTISPATGAITWLGYAPSIGQGVSVSPLVGAITWLGYAPEVSNIQEIRPAAGAIVWQGYEPTVQYSRTLEPLAGAVVWGGYAPSVSNGTTATVSRPMSDVSGTWQASTGTDKYAMLDEATMDNSDYIYTNTVGAIQRMTLNAMADPGAQGQVFSYSVWSPTGHGITVRLLNRSDDSVIAEWVHPGPLSTTAPATENDATHQSLTPTQIAAIQDYAAIDIEVEAIS